MTSRLQELASFLIRLLIEYELRLKMSHGRAKSRLLGKR